MAIAALAVKSRMKDMGSKGRLSETHSISFCPENKVFYTLNPRSLVSWSKLGDVLLLASRKAVPSTCGLVHGCSCPERILLARSKGAEVIR